MLRTLARVYNGWLVSAPITTKSITAGVLTVAGDAVAQKIAAPQDDLDYKRLGRMAFWGVVLVGPSMHYWYSGLDRIVRAPGLRGTLTKLAVDQTVFAPSIIAAFFTYTSLSEGRGIEGVKERLSQVYLPSLKANYMLWPAANFVNFYFVPSLYRVLYANTVALVWNVYICWANGQASAGKPLDLDASASASASSTEPQSPATS